MRERNGGRARRALIIGGSMSGLLAGLKLREHDWDVDIYERVESELSGRGAGIVGPKNWQFDAALSRAFQIREGKRVEFRAEAFNAFNHANFALPVGSVADTNDPSTFGVITNDAGARVMQFSLRYEF